ncbi:hypothetical protein AXG93_1474s1180 [Marchantia polymorpha subsp. ruderalis]|uniref:Uncharacterized protein n=1 Tax=Marchantia polymorpha subsp. ruderalis TaxID=1480154 RepID=A0A176WCG3_MARPO|nr:hypothetical protein AXG93_1474s1180 [Marchantia polymorpha subsp. ruderalis]
MARDQGHDDEETANPAVRVNIHGDKSIDPTALASESILAKSGGRIARWFRLRSSLLSTVPLIPEIEGSTKYNFNGEERFTYNYETRDTTATTSSRPKTKKKPKVQKTRDNSKRRQSALASGPSSSTDEYNQSVDRTKRRASTPTSRRLAEPPDTDEGSKPTALQRLPALETQEQNERIKKLRDEMAERLEQIRDIKKIQVKNKVEEKLASEIVEKEKEHEKHLEALRVTIRQELEEYRLKPLKEKLKSELDERMKSKEAQSKSDLEDVRSKIRADYASQAKALMQELEKKSQRELKPLLVEARNRVRQEAAEEEQRLEAFVNAQVAHDSQKIEEECDFRIEAINRERKERQLAVRQRGKETIESERNRPEKMQELEQREREACSGLEREEREKAQKEKESITTDFAEREALAMAALQNDSVQKLESTRNLLEENNQKKLEDCIAEIEREVEARIKSAKTAKAGEKRKFAEHRRSLLEKEVSEDTSIQTAEPAAPQAQQTQSSKTRRDSAMKQQQQQQQPDASPAAESSSARDQEEEESDPEQQQPKRTLIEEELLLQEAMKSVLGTTDAEQKKSKAKGKRVLFEDPVASEEEEAGEGSDDGSSCVRDGGHACALMMESLFQTIKASTERPRGRSFAHPRHSIFQRLKGV